MNFEKAKDFLGQFVSYEGMVRIPYSDEVFDLQRVKDFLGKYGVEYEKLKYIHVAGSKGKGSTCALIANYLWKDGYKVGLYTSPHLIEVTERIWLSGEKISRGDFARCVGDLKIFIENFERKSAANDLPKLTYFEILTVLALKYFVDNGVDYAVLEVGLGGRLDATNIVKPILSILTSVELEHTDVLGDTLDKILDEKLGIVKEGVPVLVGFQSSEALKLIRKKLGRRENVFHVRKLLAVYNFAENLTDKFSNDARFKNALQSFFSLKILLKKVDEKKFFRMAIKLKLPGIFDVRQVFGKTVILDVAHTKNSIENLVNGLREKFPGREYVFLFALMKGKDAKSILGIISTVAGKIVFTDVHEVRGVPAEELQKIAKKFGLRHEDEVVKNPKVAFRKLLKQIKKNQLLVVTGSHFLVGKLLQGSFGFKP